MGIADSLIQAVSDVATVGVKALVANQSRSPRGKRKRARKGECTPCAAMANAQEIMDNARQGQM
jgi:hypothetical protein